MSPARALLLFALCALIFAPPFVPALAQAKKKERPKAIKIKEDELDSAAKSLARFDGEQQMLLNGLRYLMRPQYELEVMAGRMFEPCALPPFTLDRKTKPMPLTECLRLWAILASGMPADMHIHRELARFMATEHERYGNTLASYAVPMAVCVAAIRRPELENAKELKALAKNLMDTAMRVRTLTAEDSPLIKGVYIEPAWYANHMWRALMCRCAIELKIKFNENVWEAELKNLSHASQEELGWISTQGKNRNAGNDLNSNLLALAAISLALSSPPKTIDNGVVNSLGKRLEYLKKLLTRLETEYPAEPLTGARLCLLRSFLPEWAPEEKEPIDWRYDLRVNAVNAQFASGAVYANHPLAEDMGLAGLLKPTRARPAIDTALSCLSVCGGLFKQVEPPLKDLKTADIEQAMKAQALHHASVLPEIPEGGDLAMEVEQAIDAGCAWLESVQNSDGTFGDAQCKGAPGSTGMALLALMHGGMAADHQVIKHGLARILSDTPGMCDRPGDIMTWPKMAGLTAYDAGIVLMMFAKYHEPLLEKYEVLRSDNAQAATNARKQVWNSLPGPHKELIQKLVKFLDDCYVGGDQGGWNYVPCIKKGFGHSDNSISQYAGCGYKCASLLGASVQVSTFENEAKRLITQYSAARDVAFIEFDSLKGKKVKDDKEGDESIDDRYSKGGAYEPRHFAGLIQPGGWSYFCTEQGKGGGCAGLQYAGTGMALLAACRDELWALKKLPSDLHKKIDLHIFGAQAWLGIHFPKEEESLPDDEEDPEEDPAEPKRRNKRTAGEGGFGSNYNLYAVERGCMMAGYERLHGDVDWYRVCARQLVNRQLDDGSWHNVLDTAMAILVLRRASIPMITQPPADPAPVPKDPPEKTQPKSPISPGAIKPEPPPPKPVGPVTPGK